MQVKLYTIPILGGEKLTEEMNVFLRSKKILQMDSRLAFEAQGSCWCFCIKYVDDLAAAERDKVKVDYRVVLDEATFKRFSKMREVRKRVAAEEGIPTYNVFLDAELAEMAKIEDLTPAAMRGVKGIGEQKMQKYGHHFIPKSQP